MSRPDLFRAESHAPGRRRRIWLGAVAALLGVALGATAILIFLSSATGQLHQADRQDLALERMAQLRTSLANFQVLIEPSLSAPRSALALADDLGKAAQLAQTIDAQARTVAGALTAEGFGAAGRNLISANADFTKAYVGLAPLAAGLPLTKATGEITAERAGFARMWDTSATARNQLQSSRDHFYWAGSRSVTAGRVATWIVAALAGLAMLGTGFVFGQRAHRRDRRERLNADRQVFSNDLQEALEMASTEPDVYRVATKGLLGAVGSAMNVQMLVADSSQAHLHEAVNTASDRASWSGCGVASPADCPATSRGHTLVFPSSQALNACPYLQDRSSGECSAVCVPISIAGKTVGVTHATGPDQVTPDSKNVRYLELTSRRASDRIAMLRAFDRSQRQARTDPLTGLLNRRSLENRVRDFHTNGVRYSVAYGDLDHFKLLNDTHGHQAGDQALRLFAQVLRDAIRPDDIVARYGGEEFILVFPQTDLEGAKVVLERVRERLALALIAGQVPAFTVSFGVAASASADAFDKVVAAADHALLAAKSAGRDRVLVSGSAAPV